MTAQRRRGRCPGYSRPMDSPERLAGDQRAVLQLVLGQGRSYGEIAGMLSIAPGEVRARRWRRSTRSARRRRCPTPTGPHRRYLLGQPPAVRRQSVREALAGSPEQRHGRASSRRSGAAGLARCRRSRTGRRRRPRPRPARRRRADLGPGNGPSPSRPRTRRCREPPSSRTGGIVLLSLLAAAIIAAIVIFVIKPAAARARIATRAPPSRARRRVIARRARAPRRRRRRARRRRRRSSARSADAAGRRREDQGRARVARGR